MRSGSWLCVGLLFFSAAALGATKNERKAAALVKKAERLYSDGKYRDAADELKKANELDPNTKLLYNIARAYDQAGDLASAADFYRQYVSATEDVDPSLVKKANLALDRLRALLAKEDAAKQAEEAEHKRLEDEKKAAEEKAQAEADAAKKQRDEYEARQKAEADAKAKSRGSRRVMAYAAGGLAVVGAGAGVFFGLGAQSSKAAFASAPDVASKRQFEGETKGKALIADVGFGVAIAAAVAAVVAWPRGGDEPAKEVGVAIVPAPGGAGVAVSF